MPRLPKGLVKRKVKTKTGRTTMVYYWRRTLDGRDQRISLGDDHARALTRFKELQRNPPAPDAPAASLSPAAPPLTLEDFSRRWLAEYVAARRTPRGRSQAEQRFRDYLWPAIGSIPLSDIKPSDLFRLSAELERSGRLVTRRRVLEDLRCCLRYAVGKAHVLDRSPWDGDVLPTIQKDPPEPLTQGELREVIGVLPERWRPVVLLLAYTGLRWGEMRGLRWEDVRDLPRPHLVISRSHYGPTKSRKAREVPLLPEAQEVLVVLKRRPGAIFTLPETASWIRRHVIQHSTVKDFHVHRLRHTFASRWLERGASKETLQVVLGHSTIKLTERYGRVNGRAVDADVDRIAGTVDGTVADFSPAKAVSIGSATGIRTPV